MSYANYEMEIANLKEEIEELEKRNNHWRLRHRECKDILKDFLTTKECNVTWIAEMRGTITAVLDDLSKDTNEPDLCKTCINAVEACVDCPIGELIKK